MELCHSGEFVLLSDSRSGAMHPHEDSLGSNAMRQEISTCLHRAFAPSQGTDFDDLLARFGKPQEPDGEEAEKSPAKRRWTAFRRNT